MWSEEDAVCGDVEKGVKFSFGNRHLDRQVVNAEKNGNIPDVQGCFSLLSYQRRAEKKSIVYMNLELRREVSSEYIKLGVNHMFKAMRIDEIIHEKSLILKCRWPYIQVKDH